MPDVVEATWVALVLAISCTGSAMGRAGSTPTLFVSPPAAPASCPRTTVAADALGSSTSSVGGISSSAQRAWFDPTNAMPPHTWKISRSPEVKMKPDLSAKGFSALNAFFFAGLSKIAYASEDEARGLLVGNSTERGLGFDRFHWFEGGEEARKNPFGNLHDTDAFVAASDDILAVVFRGTMGVADWYTNARVKPKKCPQEWSVPPPGGTVHTGFDDAVGTIWFSTPSGQPTGMYQTIMDLYNEKGKNRKLFFAGHSLGGALATNAAARVAFIDDLDIAGIYTIGSPRLFNRAAGRHFDGRPNAGKTLKEKYFRCRNNKDPVPTVPKSPYVHVGTEIYIDKCGTISMASMADRILDQLLWWLRFEYIRGIDDHSTSEYIRLFKQIVLNSRVPLMDKAVSVVMDALGDLVLKVAPDAAVNNKMLADMLTGMRKNKMVDDMLIGVERRDGLVDEAKGRARVASQAI
ncbi:unnamed protein product [Ectocarpus sp. 6 AP-2014]